MRLAVAHRSLADYETARAPVAARVASLLATAAISTAKWQFGQLLVDGAPFLHKPQVVLSAAPFMQQSAWESMTQSLWQQSDEQSIDGHLASSVGCQHPMAGWGFADKSDGDLCAAVAQVCAWGSETASRRERKLRRFEAICTACEPANAQIRAECSPSHIAEAVGPQANIAAIHCLTSVLGMDPALAEDFALGFRVCGHLPSSGNWVPDSSPPEACLDDLLGDGWNAELASSIQVRATAAFLDGGDAWADIVSVFTSTQKEVDKGLMKGFLSAADLDALFGAGLWRAMRRFPVWQRGKCRSCDNGSEPSGDRRCQKNAA